MSVERLKYKSGHACMGVGMVALKIMDPETAKSLVYHQVSGEDFKLVKKVLGVNSMYVGIPEKIDGKQYDSIMKIFDPQE